MPTSIRILAGQVSLAAELNDSQTAKAVRDVLPLEASANCWGEEIYFSIPVKTESADDARAEFEVGELGYWPPGHAFCIFFGPTPASTSGKPRMADPGNPIGRILDDIAPLRQITSGTTIRIEPD